MRRERGRGKWRRVKQLVKRNEGSSWKEGGRIQRS